MPWVAVAIEKARAESIKLIVVDITATGSFGPLSGLKMSDLQIQAICGLMDTTGAAGAAPVAIGFPFVEVSTGILAADGILAAVHARDRLGEGQKIEVALYDCAVNALTTFLPKAFAGGNPSRVGNRHPLSAPWNAFPTSDGWILMCTSSEEQWKRLAKVIDPALLDDRRFATLNERVQHVDALDEVVSDWTRRLSLVDCLAICEQVDIPAGPIQTIDQLADEPNVRYREMIRFRGSSRDAANWIPGIPYKEAVAGVGGAPRQASNRHSPAVTAGSEFLPLAGIRVVEVGQYTTAPLVAKHLASLGADVIKVEPACGDASRAWRPGQGDIGYFFALSNTDKRGVALDLKDQDGIAKFGELIQSSDVLVENMRPGALERILGGPAALGNLNPSLVHCAISGFGAASAYPNRPAFDTVAQAMSGFMDLTRRSGVPMKAGISAADILGGQVALFAILCSLRRRRLQAGAGASIDVAMQDVGVWATHPVWGQPAQPVPYLTIGCADGALIAEGEGAALSGWLVDHQLGASDGIVQTNLTRKEFLETMRSEKLDLTEVRSVADLLLDGHFKTRCIGLGRDRDGCYWPVINTPYRLQKTPAVGGRVLGKPGEDNAQVFHELATARRRRA
jgi:crotonobetainyl-CoA:carnitine CoA-transferase CaiB-like acyl-CoA transferase